jgi:hypothetical protein
MSVATLEEVNRLSTGGVNEFRVESFAGTQLVVIGSFDLCYYHDIELTFTEVEFIHCPTYFREPQFQDAGRSGEGRRFEIRTDEGRFEIVAESVSVVLGKVYHYDRGADLQPGERIAPWVKRENAERGTLDSHD